MTPGEAEQICAYIEFHYAPKTTRELYENFRVEARNRGFRPSAVAPSGARLHLNWEKGGRA
jgi:hypothetical protein